MIKPKVGIIKAFCYSEKRFWITRFLGGFIFKDGYSAEVFERDKAVWRAKIVPSYVLVPPYEVYGLVAFFEAYV